MFFLSSCVCKSAANGPKTTGGLGWSRDMRQAFLSGRVPPMNGGGFYFDTLMEKVNQLLSAR